MLWLCIHFPQFALDVFARDCDHKRPQVVCHHSRKIITLCNKAACRLGIVAGMPLTTAHALATNLQVHQHDDIQEQVAMEHLASWALQFSPVVSAPCNTNTEPSLLLEVAGSMHLFGGDQGNILVQARNGVKALGYLARLALAPTPLGATLLARAGQEVTVLSQPELTSRLQDLPLQTPGLPKPAVALLRGMGLKWIGDCARLSHQGLRQRVGAAFCLLLDRAFGRVPDPQSNYMPKPYFYSRRSLAYAASACSDLMPTAKRLLLTLEAELKAHHAGALVLQWTFFHSHDNTTVLDMQLQNICDNAKYMEDLLQVRLENLTLPDAVCEIALYVPSFKLREARNWDCFEQCGTVDNTALQQLFERLSMRLGNNAVCGVRTLAGYRPECAWQSCPPGTVSTAIADPVVRPVWLLQKPRPLMLVAGHPNLRGPLTLEGEPERIETGWWDEDTARDYYRARNPVGSRFWIYRQRGGQSWFLHGIFE